MHPILFKVGSFTVYTYGFCIALGAVLGFTYMARQGNKQFGTSLDLSHTLFLLLVVGGILGGKLFLVLEDPGYYFLNPRGLFSSSGFVFYGSLLTCIPLMLWFFKRHNIPLWAMLDVMAIVTLILHGCGRVGCFMAGCCFGKVTTSPLGVVFTDPGCQAQPLNTPLHPAQLYEAGWLAIILLALVILKERRQFEGQLFLIYLISYAAGRSVIEIFRGDPDRGFVIQQYLSNAQLVSIGVAGAALYYYVKFRKAKLLTNQ